MKTLCTIEINNNSSDECWNDARQDFEARQHLEYSPKNDWQFDKETAQKELKNAQEKYPKADIFIAEI